MLVASDKHLKAIEEIINNPKYIITKDGKMFRKMSTGLKECGYEENGYLFFKYKPNTKIALHRIIYRKYIGLLDKYLVINHKDGNGLNNNIDNLEQITQTENMVHSYRVLNTLPSAGRSKFTQKDIEEIRDMRENGNTYQDILLKFPMSKSNLSYIINHKTWYKKTTKFN